MAANDIDPRIKAAVLETIETCAKVADEDGHGDTANKIRGLAVYDKDILAGIHMLDTGCSEDEAVRHANAVRGIFSP